MSRVRLLETEGTVEPEAGLTLFAGVEPTVVLLVLPDVERGWTLAGVLLVLAGLTETELLTVGAGTVSTPSGSGGRLSSSSELGLTAAEPLGDTLTSWFGLGGDGITPAAGGSTVLVGEIAPAPVVGAPSPAPENGLTAAGVCAGSAELAPAPELAPPLPPPDVPVIGCGFGVGAGSTEGVST